jgi:hypothetical protein
MGIKNSKICQEGLRPVSAVTDNTDKPGRNGVGPTVKTMASYSVYFKGFRTFVNAAGVVARFIPVYQGYQIIGELKGIRQELVAQTGLDAPIKFATQVHMYIKDEARKTPYTNNGAKHLFFVYHPDNDWHSYFNHLVEQHPLSSRFCGMSENLDSLCLWMRFLRILFSMERRDAMSKKEEVVVFHLLIPAYRPFVIKEPLNFSDELQPLNIHGLINNTNPYVQINLPRVDPEILQGVGIWKKPQSWWPWGGEDDIPRVLGGVPPSAEEAARRQIRLRRRRIDHGSRRGRISVSPGPCRA